VILKWLCPVMFLPAVDEEWIFPHLQCLSLCVFVFYHSHASGCEMHLIIGCICIPDDECY
jgi:hypothetical protein